MKRENMKVIKQMRIMSLLWIIIGFFALTTGVIQMTKGNIMFAVLEVVVSIAMFWMAKTYLIRAKMAKKQYEENSGQK